jgi:hypothetical protein
MRRRLAFLVVFMLSLSISPRSTAYSQHCEEVNCGMVCHHGMGYMDGYCSPPGPDTTGCVQLYGPDCASMDSSCCHPTGAAASF